MIALFFVVFNTENTLYKTDATSILKRERERERERGRERERE